MRGGERNLCDQSRRGSLGLGHRMRLTRKSGITFSVTISNTVGEMRDPNVLNYAS
jgi:hypothetical protein